MSQRDKAGLYGPQYHSMPGRQVYARTAGAWQTRRGRRNREAATFINLLGLNTAFDDFHKKDGETPYQRNTRHMGDKQTTQRAQQTSRNGAKMLSVIGNVKQFPDRSAAETYLEFYEGKAIEFDIEYSGKLTGGMLYVNNTEGAKGALRVIIKQDADSTPVCDAIIDLSKVRKSMYDEKEFMFIKPLIGGKGTVRLEVFDDIDRTECDYGEPFGGKKIRVLATGATNHRYAYYTLPNTDECNKEQEYKFEDGVSAPVFGRITNTLEPMGRGEIGCCNGRQYLFFPVLDTSTEVVQMYKMLLPEGKTKCPCDVKKTRCGHEYLPGAAPEKVNAPIDKRACNVRMAQAEGYMYYVDGFSCLQRIDICTGVTELAVPKLENIDVTDPNGDPLLVADLTAKCGASLIKVVNNRLYLSGFADDPNYVEFSLINGKGAQFDQFNEGLYSPNQSYKKSSCGPITALARLDNNNLVIFHTDGNSVFSAPAGLEYGSPQQVDTFAWNMGVPHQDAVTEGNGNIYFWNRSEGFRRFGGTDASFQSITIDNELRKIKSDNDVFLMAHGNKIRFYFDRDNIGYIDHCLLYHTYLAGSSPWFMDNQATVKWGIGDQNSDTIYAMHSAYPAIFIVDDEDTFKDFDSSILAEYSTQYVAPNLMANTAVKRVQIKVMATTTSSYFIGLDPDKTDNPAVWRKPVTAQLDSDNNEDAIFGNTAETGSKIINIFTNLRCNEFQVRVARYCYKDYMELLAIVAEYSIHQDTK